MTPTQTDPADLRFGVVGLGGAASLVLPYFRAVPGIRLTAGADIRADARADFSRAFELPMFDSIESLCKTDTIDAVWIETPNHLHCEHAVLAASHGKHVICAKPLATTVAACDRMIDAARSNGVQLLLGHSKVLDSPIRAIRRIVAEGSLGRVIQVNTMLFNDWLQRPRLTSELDAAAGGGLLMRQAPHLVDIVNAIVGRPALRVRASAGRWDRNFDADGNLSALIEYDGGASATLAINAYGYFDSTELTWGIGVYGARGDAGPKPPKLPRRTSPLSESVKYQSAASVEAARHAGAHMPFFGLTLVSCERGVIRQSPEGLYVYSDRGLETVTAEPFLGRAAELIELRDALREGRDAFPGGAWGRATVELCLAMQASAATGQTVPLAAQQAAFDAPNFVQN